MTALYRITTDISAFEYKYDENVVTVSTLNVIQLIINDIVLENTGHVDIDHERIENLSLDGHYNIDYDGYGVLIERIL